MRIGWVVIKIIGTAFESVLLYKLDLLWLFFRHVCCIKRIKWLFSHTLFRPFKRSLRSRSLSFLFVAAGERLVIHTHRFGTIKSSLLSWLLHNNFFAHGSIHCFYLKRNFLDTGYHLTLKILYPYVCWWDFCVDCAFRKKPLRRLFEPTLFGLLQVLLIDKRAKHFVFDHLRHACC